MVNGELIPGRDLIQLVKLLPFNFSIQPCYIQFYALHDDVNESKLYYRKLTITPWLSCQRKVTTDNLLIYSPPVRLSVNWAKSMMNFRNLLLQIFSSWLQLKVYSLISLTLLSLRKQNLVNRVNSWLNLNTSR